MSTDHILKVSIVTPAAPAFEGAALAVTVPGSNSPFQVLYNHAPIISSLEIGVVKIEDPANKGVVFAAQEGFVEVLRNNVNIVVEHTITTSPDVRPRRQHCVTCIGLKLSGAQRSWLEACKGKI